MFILVITAHTIMNIMPLQQVPSIPTCYLVSDVVEWSVFYQFSQYGSPQAWWTKHKFITYCISKSRLSLEYPYTEVDNASHFQRFVGVYASSFFHARILLLKKLLWMTCQKCGFPTVTTGLWMPHLRKVY